MYPYGRFTPMWMVTLILGMTGVSYVTRKIVVSRQKEECRREFLSLACPTVLNLVVICLMVLLTIGRIDAGVNQWTSHGPEGEYVQALAIDPQTPTTLYAGTSGAGVFKSSNGGQSWSAINAGLGDPFVNALAIDPQTPTTLYAGTSGGVLKSSNGGQSWSAVNTGLGLFDVQALAIDPQTPTTLYAGTSGAGVFKSSNGGQSWSAINAGLGDPFVSVLAIDPQTPTTLYARASGGIFKSSNGGQSWSAINAGLDNRFVSALAIDPQTPTTLYAGTDSLVLKSSNGGQSWSAINAGLGNRFVFTLAINPLTPTTLYAGTDDGVFDIEQVALSLPVLSVTPSPLDFSSIAVGASKDLNLTVQNTGGGTLTGSCTTAAPFSLPSGCSFSLPAGQSQQVKVRFSPTAAGTFTGNVSFTSNGGNASPTVKGTGTGIKPTVTWITPPPSSVTSGQPFTMAWSITGALTVQHVNVHWDPTDPTSINTCSSAISCSTVSPTSSPITLIAPSVTTPTVLKYVVHANVNGDGIARFSAVVSVRVDPSPATRAPSPPTALGQFRSDGATSISPIGTITNESVVVFKATVNDPDGDKVKLQIELRRLDEFGGAFTGQPTQESTFVSSASQAQVIAFGLVNGNYHWQARTINSTGAMSNWLSFGGNSENAANFIVNRPQSAADLAVIGVNAHPLSSSDNLLLRGKPALVDVTIKNLGSAPLPRSQYMVEIIVWDIKGKGSDSTFAKRATDGRWPSQPPTQVVISLELAPKEAKLISMPVIFSSSLFADEVEVRLLPPYEGAPAFDSNPDNDFNTQEISVFSGDSGNIRRCFEEVWSTAFMAAFFSITFAEQGAIATGAITVEAAKELRDLAKIAYHTGLSLWDLYGPFRDAVRAGQMREAGGILVKIIARLSKEFLAKELSTAWNILQIGLQEVGGIGCFSLFPSLSDAKELFWSMAQGFQEELNTLGGKVYGFLGGSPIDLVVMDSAGRRVAVRLDGTVESEIPEAIAFRINDVSTSVIVIPRSDTYTFKILGLATGTARVGVSQPRSDGSVSTVIYKDVPQRVNSSNAVVVGPTTIQYPLQVDINGDGSIDETRQPNSVNVFTPPVISPLALSTTALPSAVIGTPYLFQVAATGGLSPYQFTLAKGVLPAGLGFLGTGEIVGIPTATGSAPFTIKVEDLLGSSATATFAFNNPLPACATNVSPQVTIIRGGFRKNSTTGRYVQTMTFKNTSSNAIAGPVSLVLDALSSNATLFNKNGVTSCATPTGSPVIDVNVGTDNVLSAGESASVVVEFANPNNQSITYNTRVLAGSGTR